MQPIVCISVARGFYDTENATGIQGFKQSSVTVCLTSHSALGVFLKAREKVKDLLWSGSEGGLSEGVGSTHQERGLELTGCEFKCQ